MTGAIDLGGGIIITQNRLFIIVFGFAVLGAIVLITRYTVVRAADARRDAEPRAWPRPWVSAPGASTR